MCETFTDTTGYARLRKQIMARPKRVAKKREKKNVPLGVAHIQASFNNTIITFTDTRGNTVSWASAGQSGFKGSRKSTPFAAQVAAEQAARKAQDNGMRTVGIYVKGPGSGREAAMRAINAAGFKVAFIRDVTPWNWAEAEIPMTMEDWAKHLDRILTSTEENLLTRKGTVSHLQAMEKAQTEYKKYKAKTLSSVERIIWKV